MTHFKKYLRESNSLQSDFANKIGVKQSTVSRLSSGTTKPSLELAVIIERETGGAVPASSWIAPQKEGAA